MEITTNADEMMRCFRLASRELFNNFFRSPLDEEPWLAEERFKDVQLVLFKKMVIEPLDLSDVGYGDVNKDITVQIRTGSIAPIMINREIKSGYWDHPTREINTNTKMSFISFFDFNPMRCLDNQYVCVLIDCCLESPEVVGKRALIEYLYVKFEILPQPPRNLDD